VPVLVVLLGVIAYSNSLDAAFVFDDITRLLRNPEVRSISSAIRSWRPVLMLSFALNYVAWGHDPAGYRIVNVAIHILGALCLFGIVRRTLLLSRFGSRFRDAAAPIAFAAASLWLVHPLQTGAVTYVIQRAESLMGLFYLLTMYCAIRGFERHPDPASGIRHPASRTPNSAFWYFCSILSCALGMGTKEVMITAPVMLFVFDAVFLSGGVRRSFRDRWLFYVGLVCTWGVLGLLMFSRSLAAPDRAFAQPGISMFRYGLTQLEVIAHYLRLCFVPWPLRIDYAWPLATGLGDVAVPAAVVSALAVLTVVFLCRRPSLGFLGFWFFGVLAPTSSIIPRPDPAFEHRMYLPLASVVLLTVLAVNALIGRAVGGKRSAVSRRVVSIVLVVAALCGLVLLTRARNGDYASAETMWRREVELNPGNPRAYNELAASLIPQRRFSEVTEAATTALWVQFHGRPAEEPVDRLETLTVPPGPDVRAYALAHTYLGVALHYRRGYDDAAVHYRMALKAYPSLGEARKNLARISLARGDKEGALEHLSETLARDPDDSEAHQQAGDVLAWDRKYVRAIEHYEAALRLYPGDPVAMRSLAWLFSTCEEETLHDAARAVELASRAARITHQRDFDVLDTLSAAYARAGRFEEAVTTIRQAIAMVPEPAKTARRAMSIRLRLYTERRPFTRPPARQKE